MCVVIVSTYCLVLIRAERVSRAPLASRKGRAGKADNYCKCLIAPLYSTFASDDHYAKLLAGGVNHARNVDRHDDYHAIRVYKHGSEYKTR